MPLALKSRPQHSGMIETLVIAGFTRLVLSTSYAGSHFYDGEDERIVGGENPPAKPRTLDQERSRTRH